MKMKFGKKIYLLSLSSAKITQKIYDTLLFYGEMKWGILGPNREKNYINKAEFYTNLWLVVLIELALFRALVIFFR